MRLKVSDRYRDWRGLQQNPKPDKPQTRALLSETGLLGNAMIRVRMIQYQSEDQIDETQNIGNSICLIIGSDLPFTVDQSSFAQSRALLLYTSDAADE